MVEPHVAFYARVSSDQQAAVGTIESQVAALDERALKDGFKIPLKCRFVDEGYSGSNLVRPALERLRDMVAEGAVNRIYVHSPDRLARNYAYQVVLLDEFIRAGAEVVFLNQPLRQSPEADLLIQVQGMISEYERAKIMERCRRGKRFAAKNGSVNVLSCAAYGYRFVPKHQNCGVAKLEVIPEQAEVVRRVFDWIGQDRMSIGEVCRRLTAEGIPTYTGKTTWDRESLRGMLRNRAYIGTATFGKRKVGEWKPPLRPRRGNPEHPRKAISMIQCPESEWIKIPVPPIVDSELFDAVQAQLQENRERSRVQHQRQRYLLQGLAVCKRCGFAFFGKRTGASPSGTPRDYSYYRCMASLKNRYTGEKTCTNRPIRSTVLDSQVWEAVKALLREPQRLESEYARRLEGSGQKGRDQLAQIVVEEGRLNKTVSRLIDGYAQGWIEKEEFEPRVKALRERLAALKAQDQILRDEASAENELRYLVGQFQTFAEKIRVNLETADWETRRDLIRILVKRVEVDVETVNIVFRVSPPPSSPGRDGGIVQHCPRRRNTTAARTWCGSAASCC